MTATEIPADNGVNVEALLGVRDALPGSPEIAQFQWRSAVSWVGQGTGELGGSVGIPARRPTSRTPAEPNAS